MCVCVCVRVQVWDRRTLRENSPVPVGVMAGHVDGVTYIDTKVGVLDLQHVLVLTCVGWLS